MTEKLYEKDAYCKSFDAVVTECRQMDGKYGIVLDKTAFFPEGGGQDADEGLINGLPVLDVQEEGAAIVHILESELETGAEVSCEIDWDVRYARMQGHTGEHIISGVVHSLYGYDNVGFHMGDKTMSVDFNGSLSADDIRKIELKANEAVYANADVVAYYPAKEELEKLQYRSKLDLESDVRIVTIGEDIDCCACCAPHVERTGEVGMIKVIDFASYKQGTRIEMVAGKNALLDYMSLNSSIKEIMKMLSAPRDGVVEAVRERNSAYQTLRGDYQKVAKRLAFLELELTEANDMMYAMTENLFFDDLRYCANQLTENSDKTYLLLSKNGESGYNYVISSKANDVRETAKKLNEAFSGKGGGQSGYVQGKLGNYSQEEVRNFVENM